MTPVKRTSSRSSIGQRKRMPEISLQGGEQTSLLAGTGDISKSQGNWHLNFIIFSYIFWEKNMHTLETDCVDVLGCPRKLVNG